MKEKPKINSIVKNGICIGCGLCASWCSQDAISVHWAKSQKWVPAIDDSKCTNCGLCFKGCPCTAECIIEYAISAAKAGEFFGLSNATSYFIAYDLNPEHRIQSASGGLLTQLLIYLLNAGEIKGILAPIPVTTPIGKPHYELAVIKSAEQLHKARSSHYYPLCYKNAIEEITKDSGEYAIVGLPCIIRGVRKLPQSIRSKFKYTFSLACGHNVTGRFLDCLAKQEGIAKSEAFTANLRDKLGGIKDADNFNNYFKLSNREIRRNRFETNWTKMWESYFFAQESCLYCPDFFGVDADLSVKDAWGHPENNPLGASLLVLRNSCLVDFLEELKRRAEIFLEPCDANQVFSSQIPEIQFKHFFVSDRLVWKAMIRNTLKNHSLGTRRRWWKRSSLQYWQFRLTICLSNFFYSLFGKVPVKAIVLGVFALTKSSDFLRIVVLKFKKSIVVTRK